MLRVQKELALFSKAIGLDQAQDAANLKIWLAFQTISNNCIYSVPNVQS